MRTQSKQTTRARGGCRASGRSALHVQLCRAAITVGSSDQQSWKILMLDDDIKTSVEMFNLPNYTLQLVSSEDNDPPPGSHFNAITPVAF